MDAKGWDARYAASTTPVWHVEPNVWVREGVQILSPGRAVDVAAGEGRHAIWLATRGWQVDAVDFSAVGLERGCALARERGVAHLITWNVADVVQTPPAPGAYDLAVVAYLHLVPDALRAALRGAASSLAPGGTLLVVGHDATNLTDGVGGPQDPRVLYGPHEVAEHLVGTAVEIEIAETRRRAVAGADRPALDAVVVAVRAG